MIRVFFKSGGNLDLAGKGPMDMKQFREMVKIAALSKDWVDITNDQGIPVASFPGNEVRMLMVVNPQSAEDVDGEKKDINKSTAS